jgi:uncharacterized short protein YbdD (DUF466 family)
MKALRNLLGTGWKFLQEVSGERDYARYRERVVARGQEPITPREFYVRRQEAKYSSAKRCC